MQLFLAISERGHILSIYSVQCHLLSVMHFGYSHIDNDYLVCLARVTYRSILPSCFEQAGSHLPKHTWSVSSRYTRGITGSESMERPAAKLIQL